MNLEYHRLGNEVMKIFHVIFFYQSDLQIVCAHAQMDSLEAWHVMCHVMCHVMYHVMVHVKNNVSVTVATSRHVTLSLQNVKLKIKVNERLVEEIYTI